ncbi:hypothetical protein H2198_000671 [Neophaeococcomyces mojaviensis]|uniref:Uncharacterized protein n=1 Tax=Neophaeococcomyces mojaviensis TaxID=3383035 RepID=A0ACC3AJK4_9EURO|nr:hypothetical protein H2198_000671 [Knufia sp. JES_112]
MQETSHQPPERYAIVSSLYGPGTITCWYLTILSILVSWTLHPRKRISGSIDVDLIAMLTLPSVAAGHLISQVSMLMRKHDNSLGSDIDVNQFPQSIAAIEAPFRVVESFMPISAILFLVAMWMFCLRRAISVAMVGLLCLATECYIHFSNLKELGIRYDPTKAQSDDKPAFSRSFVADFTGLVIAILVTLAICAITASMTVTYMLHSQRVPQDQRVPQENGRAEQGRLLVNPGTLREASEAERELRLSSWISLFFLVPSALLSIVPSAFNSTVFVSSYLTNTGRTTTFWSRLKIFAGHFYPQSSNSFSDLDQAVSTAAGATILGFSIYSVASSYYGIQSNERRMRLEEDRIELDRLNQD